MFLLLCILKSRYGAKVMTIHGKIPALEKELLKPKLLGEVIKSRGSIHAQKVVKERLIEAYGNRIKVDFSETTFEESNDGRGFWLVEGNVAVKKWLFLKNVYHFLYYVDAETSRITIMRGRRE
jgi:hypothetical protein